MGKVRKNYTAPKIFDPKPYCPVHDKKLVMTRVGRGKGRIVGVCPEPSDVEELAGGDSTGHHVQRGQWVSK